MEERYVIGLDTGIRWTASACNSCRTSKNCIEDRHTPSDRAAKHNEERNFSGCPGNKAVAYTIPVLLPAGMRPGARRLRNSPERCCPPRNPDEAPDNDQPARQEPDRMHNCPGKNAPVPDHRWEKYLSSKGSAPHLGASVS